MTPSSQSWDPTYGSLAGPDILLTNAYYEQFHKLGWFQFCLGRITLKWSHTVAKEQTIQVLIATIGAPL